MKKILISTGTTKFESLVQRAIEIFDESIFDLTIQTPTVINHDKIKSFLFIENIKDKYKNFDIIITHAGAGNCYQLLENNHTVIVVPNLDRRDKHQSDLGNYLQKNNYCSVCWELKNLKSSILEQDCKSFSKYSKTHFFRTDLIN